MNSPRDLVPAPVMFPGDEPFWDGAREGRLMARHCPACDALHFHPREHCPLCGHARTQWRALSGRGQVYSHTRVERAPRPTAPVVIDLEEGLRITSVVVDADVHQLRIGDPVIARFIPSRDGPPVPAFTTPAAEAARAYSARARAALGVPDASTPAFAQAAVIGGGNMGVGITLALLAAGLGVCLIDTTAQALEDARQRIEAALEQEIARGRLERAVAQQRLDRLATDTRIDAVASADVVIEAVWEDIALKRELFAAIDTHARPGALLGTNTSTLDIGQIASATSRPGDVVGLHFFNPAQVMRLLEVVRSPLATPTAIAAARAFAHQIGKTPIVVGICDGFVGNRLMITRERQAGRLLLEGSQPDAIDGFMRAFGLPMGTFELQDMAGGIPLTYHARQRAGQRDWLIEQLFTRGRTGLRAGRGYYRYDDGKRRPRVDPEVTALIEEASRVEGIERRVISDEEIHDRLILPMINEGAKLLQEGVVERASDIDLVWQLGYGWPDWKGGPMHYADTMGLAEVVARLRRLQATHGELFRPADRLVQLAATGGRISAS